MNLNGSRTKEIIEDLDSIGVVLKYMYLGNLVKYNGFEYGMDADGNVFIKMYSLDDKGKWVDCPEHYTCENELSYSAMTEMVESIKLDDQLWTKVKVTVGASKVLTSINTSKRSI